MEWINTGFERNEKGEVVIYWECSECEFEAFGVGMQKPVCACPICKREPENVQTDSIR